MKRYIFIILFLLSLTGYSQNLVPNPSFEIITHCPDDNGAIIYAPPWFNPIRVVSPDLFNICSPFYLLGVPDNSWGYQMARTGAGYSGICVYGLPAFIDTMVREYISVKLLSTLIANHKYGVHFYCSVGEKNTTYAINRLGVYVSKDSIFGHTLRPLPYVPQIHMDTCCVMKDTVNWVPVSGIYTATGGEKYITIGNFYIDSLIKIETVGYAHTTGSYYFVDDVSVYEITDPLYTAEAGENSTICRKDSVIIGSPGHPNYRYKWKPSRGLSCDTVAQPTAKPFVTTTYHLTQYDYTDLETYDSVTVTVKNCDSTAQDNILLIYPNPLQGEFYIEFSEYVPEDAMFTVSNTLGQVLIKNNITREEKKKLVNTGFLASGAYFCRVYAGENLLRSEKIVRVKNEK